MIERKDQLTSDKVVVSKRQPKTSTRDRSHPRGRLLMLAQEPGGTAYKAKKRVYEKGSAPRRAEHRSGQSDHVRPGRRQPTDSESQSTPLIAEESGASVTARELALKLRRVLVDRARPYRRDGIYIMPSESSRGYGGQYWLRDNTEEIKRWLDEGVTAESVWAAIEDAFADPVFGHHVYNVWTIRRTLDTNLRKLWVSAYRDAKRWHRQLPEQIRKRKLQRLRRIKKHMFENAGVLETQEEQDAFRRDLDAISEEILRLKEEPLLPLSAHLSPNDLGIQVESKRNTYPMLEWYNQDDQSMSEVSPYLGMWYPEQRVLANELLATQDKQVQELVIGKIILGMTYRDLEQEYDLPSSTADRWIRGAKENMRIFAEQDMALGGGLRERSKKLFENNWALRGKNTPKLPLYSEGRTQNSFVLLFCCVPEDVMGLLSFFRSEPDRVGILIAANAPQLWPDEHAGWRRPCSWIRPAGPQRWSLTFASCLRSTGLPFGSETSVRYESHRKSYRQKKDNISNVASPFFLGASFPAQVGCGGEGVTCAGITTLPFELLSFLRSDNRLVVGVGGV